MVGEKNILSDLPKGLLEAARVSMEEVIGLQKDEKVLIVTNPGNDVFRISKALYDASAALEGIPTLIVQPVKTQLDFANGEVLGALRTDPDVLISISQEKLGKDIAAIKDPIKIGDSSYDHYFNYLLGEKKARSFWSPSVTEDMFIRTVPIDYSGLRNDCSRLKEVMDRGDIVHIDAPSGTNIDIGIKGREGRSDDGDFKNPGSGGNLPAGEMFISPELGSSRGRIVFDGSIASDRGIILIADPIECDVEENMVTCIFGGDEAKELRDTISRAKETTQRFVDEGKIKAEDLDQYRKNTSNLGELGIGLNRKASIIGNMLEDEKVYGTCHIAIGSNYDNDARSLIHLDGLIKAPTLTVMGNGSEEIIMKNGELVI